MSFLDSIPELLFLAFWFLVALALLLPSLLRAHRARRAKRRVVHHLGKERVGIR